MDGFAVQFMQQCGKVIQPVELYHRIFIQPDRYSGIRRLLLIGQCAPDLRIIGCDLPQTGTRILTEQSHPRSVCLVQAGVQGARHAEPKHRIHL